VYLFGHSADIPSKCPILHGGLQRKVLYGSTSWNGESSVAKQFPSVVAAGIMLATSVLPVAAADLTVKAPVAPLAVPTYNWTGLYLGLNGGGGWGSQDPLNIITDRFDRSSTDISGGMFGGTMGAQVQVSHVVLGLEADLDWAHITGSRTISPSILGAPLGTFSASTKMDWIGTARARAGYAQNNWLLYITGGATLAEEKTSLTGVNGSVCGIVDRPFCSGSGRKVGAAAGAGIEYGITPNLSAKLEYMYMTAASTDVSRINSIRLGLNYRFGGF
jgi:outer membrane immunogenic protein